ncbi:MAG: IclR family transcriptional regulator [Propionibacteriaceae bacterium]
MTQLHGNERSDDGRRQGPDGLRALDRAATILYALAGHPEGIALADLSRETGLTMTTVHRMLASLRSKNLTRETSEGLHAIGLGSLVLSGAFLAGLDLSREARPHLERLNTESTETCHLGVLASPHVVYIQKMDSSHPVRMFSRVGATMPAVLTAMGKAMLAHSSADAVAGVLHDTSEQLGSVVSERTLRKVLAEDLGRGFSTDLEENERGICCVGAPIIDHLGHVVAAISVSTPTERFDRDRLTEVGGFVRSVADDISEALGHMAEGRAEELRRSNVERDARG